MKNLFFFFSLLFITGNAIAQNEQINTGIPPFRILKTDSTWFTPRDIPKNKPVMIIYFSPDCSHCEHLMGEMKPKLKQFRNTQIVMITYIQPGMLRAIKDFYRKFGLAKYANITVGTEGYTFVVQKYYKVAITPYIAIYNRNGKLISAYPKPPSINDLLRDLKKA